MFKGTLLIVLLQIAIGRYASAHIYNPYSSIFSRTPPLNPFAPPAPPIPAPYLQDNILLTYVAQPDHLPVLNVLVEEPQLIHNDFTVVPLLVMSQENMQLVSDGKIMNASTEGPQIFVNKNGIDMQCLPAVRITLRKPIIVYSLKSSIPFPASVEVIHADDYRMTIDVGAVIAPLPPRTFVSTQSPVAIKVVYAVPTQPVHYDYVNNDFNVVDDAFSQSVLVDSIDAERPAHERPNITIINFPDKISEPTIGSQIDLDDDELVNRNPPMILAPAGIVQSSQPQPVISEFTNSKESPLLIALRDESLKSRL